MRKAAPWLAIAFLGCSSAPKVTYQPEADREGVRQTVGQHMKELRECYYQTLDTHPAAEGKVTLAWELTADGQAKGTRLESFQGRRGIEAIEPCLVMRVNSWRFPVPNPNETMQIQYPLYFSENGKMNFDDLPVQTPKGLAPNLPAK